MPKYEDTSSYPEVSPGEEKKEESKERIEKSKLFVEAEEGKLISEDKDTSLIEEPAQTEAGKNKPTTVAEDYLKAEKVGKEIFEALNQNGKEAVEKGRQQRELAWSQAGDNLSKFYGDFERLENASDEELKEQYLKYYNFEPNYLGKMLVSLDSLATRDGFSKSYLNSSESTGYFAPKIDLIIKMLEKIAKIDKELKGEFVVKEKEAEMENKEESEEKIEKSKPELETRL
ncbi:MAG: hypothetical protein QMD65_02800 [Patescibacteria group bacterium]|nr:hypothetical protein [Patescibacteria group bacterium]